MFEFKDVMPSFIIVFREMIEAGLIIGIVLAATQGVPHRRRWVTGGVIAGILGALILAVFAGALSETLDGIGQDVFNAGILFFAVGMLAWHNVWMATHGRQMAGHLKAVGTQIKTGEKSLFALALVIALAVLREGSEVVLFLYGMLASGKMSVSSVMSGLSFGIGAGSILSALMYLGLVMVPLKQLFRVTSVMITLLAAGMASQGALFLAQSGLVTRFSGTVWDTSWFLEDGTILARILSVLVGYTAQPTGLQVVAYFITLAFISIATYTLAGGSEGTQNPAEAAQ